MGRRNHSTEKKPSTLEGRALSPAILLILGIKPRKQRPKQVFYPCAISRPPFFDDIAVCCTLRKSASADRSPDCFKSFVSKCRLSTLSKSLISTRGMEDSTQHMIKILRRPKSLTHHSSIKTGMGWDGLGHYTLFRSISSHIRTLERWPWRALCNEVPFRLTDSHLQRVLNLWPHDPSREG